MFYAANSSLYDADYRKCHVSLPHIVASALYIWLVMYYNSSDKDV